MTPEQIDRVFGRGRLKMVTGPHVEVFREAAAAGESRRYTKRFLTTVDGDYAQWTEREWRILARLIGHGSSCVPDVVQYDRGAQGTKLVQTYDAGATVDQWATLLPVERDGRAYAHVFEDCAHWWALAHHCLAAIDEIHTLQLVHLDIKGDNICIPIGPATFDHAAAGQRLFPVFRKLTLIDFAFSLVSGERLTTPLPIGWQQEYDYQSPRLLHALEAGRAGDLQPTEDLDWRCDMYSLAAMLKRYLPRDERLDQPALACGWTAERYDAAKALILSIREAHDGDLPLRRPHFELITRTSARVRESELAQSLERGWTLARDAQTVAVAALPLTPITRLAPPLRLVVPPRDDLIALRSATRARDGRGASPHSATPRRRLRLIAAATAVAAVASVPFFADTGAVVTRVTQRIIEGAQGLWAAAQGMLEPDAASGEAASSHADADESKAAASPTQAANAQSADSADPGSTAGDSTGRDASNSATQSGASATSTPPSATAREAVPSSPSSRPSASSPAVSQARVPGGFQAARPETYPSKPAPQSARVARTPPPTTATRTPPSRPTGSTPGTQVASASKATRSASSADAIVARSQQQVLAFRRSGNTSLVASRVQPPTAPNPAASSAVDASPPASPRTDGTPIALVPKEATTGGGTIAQNAPTAAARAPSGAAALPASRANPEPRVATTQLSPTVDVPGLAPVEPARATPAPTNAMASAPGLAPIVEAPRTLAPPVIQAPRPLAALVIPAPRQSAPPMAEAFRARPFPALTRDDDTYLARAHRALADLVPRTSAQTRAQIERVLWIAAYAHHPSQERAVIAAAGSSGGASDAAFVTRDGAPGDARRLHEEARQAFRSRRHVQDALDLELRAFGANPIDPEIAGQLAFLYLKVVPAQPERGRQLALHAIGIRNAQYQTGRPEDWTTFAIASALTGRETDARHAFFASVALARNVDLVCGAALSAFGTFGEPLRGPVEALLDRLHAQGRADDSPYCAWPNRVTRHP